MDSTFVCIFSLLIFLLHPQEVKCRNIEKNLMDELFKDYNMKVRPVQNVLSTVQLKFDIALKQILDVDERNQIITTNVWIRQYWKDEFLRWNKSDFGNINSIRVDAALIWKPDLRLYNTAQENYKGIDVESKTKATIYHDGQVAWLSPHILKSVCKMDVTYFPFDDQRCPMVFASWAYHGLHVNISSQREAGDLVSYSESGEFKLMSYDVQRIENHYDCCVEPYPELIYTIHLRRLVRFYLMNTIVPSTLISFLAFLSFGLPPDSGERVGLVITTLLSLAVFMMIISDQIPPTSEVFPLLQKFLTAVMLEIGIALVANCVVITWAAKGEPPSEFVKKMLSFKYLRSLCSCKNKDEVVKISSQENGQVHINEHAARNNGNQTNGGIELSKTSKKLEDNYERKVLKNLEVISSATILKKSLEMNAAEWKLAAATLDRLCVVLFVTTIFATMAYIFISAPRITL